MHGGYLFFHFFQIRTARCLRGHLRRRRLVSFYSLSEARQARHSVALSVGMLR